MLLKRCEHTKATLEPFGIVVSDVVLDYLEQFLPAGETLPIIAFSLENAPEALHRSVIDALTCPRHTLGHVGRSQLIVKYLGCILEASAAVKQRMCVRIFRHCPVKSLVDQSVVIGVPDNCRDDPAVAQIEIALR